MTTGCDHGANGDIMLVQVLNTTCCYLPIFTYILYSINETQLLYESPLFNHTLEANKNCLT